MAGSVKKVQEALRRHPRRTAIAAAALALALVAAGLGAVLLRPGGPALSVSPEAYLDTGRDLGMQRVIAAGFRGDSAVVMGTFGNERLRLAVVDADSGEPRWVRDTGTLLDADAALSHADLVVPPSSREVAAPVLTGSGDDWSVIVPYFVSGQEGDTDPEEQGVAALSGSDGSVRWKRETTGPPRVLDGAEETVLVGVRAPGEGSEERTGEGKVTSLALDAADGGKALWKHEGIWVHRLAGDTALGEFAPEDWIPGDPALNADMLAEGHRSLAFDARTGRPKWDLDGAFSRSGVVEATEGWAVLYAVPENGWLPARTAVVDTDTGEEAFSLRSRLGTEPPGCAVGEDGLLVCVHEAGDTFELISVAPGEPGVQRSAEIAGLDTDSMSSVRVQAVSGGRIHLAGSRWSEGEDEEKRFAVDRFGALLAEDLPGEVVAAAPDRVAVTAVLAGEDGAEPVEFRRTAEGGTPPAPESDPAAVEALPIGQAPRFALSTSAFDGPALGGTELDTDPYDLHDAALAGGSLVYSAETGDGSVISGLDPDTGKERWTLGDVGGPDGIGYFRLDPEELPFAGADGGTLLVPHSLDGGRDGVSGVSAEDGRLLWTEPFGGGAGSLDHLIGSEEDLFAAYRTDIGDSSVTAARTEVREADSGRLVHTEEDAEAAGIGGGVLVVERRTPPYDPAPAGPPADDVAGVDPRTGEERWSLDGRYERPRVAAVAGDRAVLVEHGGGTAVLDPATGEEIAATATRADRCSGTAEPLLVCRAGGNGTGDGSAFPVVVEVGGDRASIRLLPGIPAPERLSGLERWLFAPDPDPLEREAAADRSGEAPYLMHDAYGRPLRDGLPGRAVAADDEHVVLLDGGPDGPARLTVHRRG
ncbi:hypothetical protein GCM10009605_55610 [Nocardiopsis composta]